MTMTPSDLHLIIATPSLDGKLTGLYVNSMLKLQPACRNKGIRMHAWVLPGDALIPRARQELAGRFVDVPDTTHLLFIDSDLGFEPDQVFRLLDFDADISAGIYPHKWMDPQRLKKLVLEGKNRPDAAALTYVVEPETRDKAESRNGFMKVRYAGTGFLMIKRSALLSMMAHYPDLRYLEEANNPGQSSQSRFRHALFNCMVDPETGDYLSEDYSFCRRWLAMGGNIWADMNSHLTHMGPTAVRGDFAAQWDGLSNPEKT